MKKSLDSRISRLIIWIEVALVLCLAAIWYFGFHGKSDKGVAGSGELRVLTRNASTTYFQSQGEPRGFEYELIQAFARENGRRVRVIVKNSLQAVLDGMKNGEGDIAAAGLLQTESLAKQFRIGPVYRRVSQQVVCRNDRTLPAGPDDLTEVV